MSHLPKRYCAMCGAQLFRKTKAAKYCLLCVRLRYNAFQKAYKRKAHVKG